MEGSGVSEVGHISQLIENLQKIQKRHGDLLVFGPDFTWGFCKINGDAEVGPPPEEYDNQGEKVEYPDPVCYIS